MPLTAHREPGRPAQWRRQHHRVITCGLQTTSCWRGKHSAVHPPLLPIRLAQPVPKLERHRGTTRSGSGRTRSGSVGSGGTEWEITKITLLILREHQLTSKCCSRTQCVAECKHAEPASLPDVRMYLILMGSGEEPPVWKVSDEEKDLWRIEHGKALLRKAWYQGHG